MVSLDKFALTRESRDAASPRTPRLAVLYLEKPSDEGEERQNRFRAAHDIYDELAACSAVTVRRDFGTRNFSRREAPAT